VNVRSGNGQWIFGCDICQDVCPWNRRAAETDDPEFASVISGALLEELATLSGDDFRTRFRHTPVWRVKYSGFLRNVAIAMGNSKDPKYRSVLEQLAASEDEIIASHANWALRELEIAECA
jgi:epoxyqueuosine reductase